MYAGGGEGSMQHFPVEWYSTEIIWQRMQDNLGEGERGLADGHPLKK